MSVQNYATHRRFVPLYHYYLTGFVFATLIGSVINLVKSINAGSGVYSASLILAVILAMILVGFFARTFALRAQDRVIRAEENLRHYIKFGSLLDPRLKMRQIIGLRFASDEEYEALIHQAIEKNLAEEDIKKAVKNWRADEDRM